MNPKKMLAAAVIMIAAAVAALVVFNNYSPSLNTNGENIRQSITTELLKNPEIKPFENATVDMRQLNETDLASLKAEQPVVYSGAAAGDYLVVFDGTTDSMIVIYDYDGRRIVNMFAVRNVIL